MNKVDLVILCGGRGSRLKKLTINYPKPLLKIEGIPFIKFIINRYQKLNLNKIYLLAGYKGNLIKKKFHLVKHNLIDTEVIIEKKPMGTAGALSLIKKKIKNKFILLNADSYVEHDLEKFFSKKNSLFGKMILVKNKNYKSNSKLSNLSLKKGLVSFNKNSNLMNAGIYFFDKKIFKFIKNTYQSLENEVLPILINKKKICGNITKSKFIDIGIKKNYKIAKKNFFKRKKALFLDRDGVINKDKGYVHNMKGLEWTKNIFNSLKYANKNFDHIFIITNQSGIGRGIYTEDQFINFQKKIKNIFLKKKIYIDEVYYCPHHPIYGIKKYKIKCRCRKPQNLMVEKAVNDWFIDRKKSLMIGDNLSDEICAKRSNIRFAYKEFNFLKQLKSFK